MFSFNAVGVINTFVQIKEFLDAIAPTPVGGWVGPWVKLSDFGDSYRIYRACEFVLKVTGFQNWTCWLLLLDLSVRGGWAKNVGNHNLGFAHSDPALY